MPRGTLLTDFEKGQISALQQEGHPEQEIARRVGRSRKCVSNYLRDPLVGDRRHNGGRKRKLDERDKRTIDHDIKIRKFSVRNILKTNNLQCSHMSIYRYVSTNPEFYHGEIATSEVVSEAARQERVAWARQKLAEAIEWIKYIFSDEKVFHIDCPKGLRKCWHWIHEEPHHVIEHFNGGTGFMVWGCIGVDFKTDLVFIEGTVDQDAYIRILEDSLLPRYTSERVFIQDNAPAHRGKNTAAWLQGSPINSVRLPPYSPDINIIENVWAYMANEIYAGGKQYLTVAELKRSVLQSWNNLPTELVRACVESIPERLHQIIEADGHTIST